MRVSSSARIMVALLAGLVLGISLSMAGPAWLPRSIAAVEPIGLLWLDALRMTIIPLVFALLVTGIASTAATASAGGLATRSLLTFVVILLSAAAFGEIVVTAFLAIWPIPAEAVAALRAGLDNATGEMPPAATFAEWLRAIVPTNPVKAAANGEMLPLALFALLFGFAITRLARAPAMLLAEFFQAVVEAMMVIVHWVILVAPIGVFALAYILGARAGVAAVGALAHYLVLVVVAQVLLIEMVNPLVEVGARLPLSAFARAVAPAQAVAASTQSSLASLPAMVESTRQLRIAPHVSALVLPLAVSVFRFTSPVANLAVVLYSASLFGVELGLGHYVVGAVVGLLMSLASVGLPGQVSFFASITPICLAMGVPVGMLPLLLAVESIPDIFRTIGNVTADVGGTAVLARRGSAHGFESEPGESA
jgi:Na+/H+-dicarboxylate symporter